MVEAPAPSSPKPVYGLAMIVKDEQANIRRCLESVLPHIGWWSISDTGSSDSTREIIADSLADIPGELIERPWQDFGTNRSEVLAAVRGHAQFVLTLDADATCWIDPDFEPDPAVEAYMLGIEMGGLSWRLPWLIRGDLPWRSVGAVHEYLDLPGRQYVRVPTDKIHLTVEDRSSPEKSKWHAKMLEAEMKAHPGDPRTVFYLAQTYRDLDDDRARNLYLKRVKMGGWDQEVFYARYRAALLAEWPQRMNELLAAWESRPARLEPLHDLVSELNRRELHRAAYALTAVDLTPTDDALFVHPHPWRWGMMFERSIAAWWVGERGEAAMLNARLLEMPDLPANIRAAVERNAAL